MILVGMFDSPFVRRVAISAAHLGFDFEHRNWSVGKDAALIRQFHPQGRVPVLVLDDGEALTSSRRSSSTISIIWPVRSVLLPAADPARRETLKLVALATGALDKGILLVYERIFRPAEKHHAPWLQRCRAQAEASLAELEAACAAREGRDWLVGDAISQADITLACAATYLRDAVPLDLAPFPALQARVARYEALPLFARFYLPFDAPNPT